MPFEPKGARPFLVVAWYRPPAEPVETFTKLEKNLDLESIEQRLQVHTQKFATLSPPPTVNCNRS